MTTLATVILLAMGMLLAGCGYTSTGTQGSGDTGGTSSTPGGSGPIAGTSVRPCVGPYADVGVEGQPALVLTDTTSGRTGSVHTGDLVQIQLPGDWHWTLNAASANLTATQYAGAYDQTRGICFWDFKATASGSASVQFTGTPRCEGPNQPCPTLARAADFTISVG